MSADRDDYLAEIFGGPQLDDPVRDRLARVLPCSICGADVAVAAGALAFSVANQVPLVVACAWHRPTRKQLLAKGTSLEPAPAQSALGISFGGVQRGDSDGGPR